MRRTCAACDDEQRVMRSATPGAVIARRCQACEEDAVMRTAEPAAPRPPDFDFARIAVDTAGAGRVRVSQPGEALEREADRVAERVLRTGGAGWSATGPTRAAPALLRRPAASGGPGRLPVGPLADTGQPLPRDVRDQFEAPLATDLSTVRVHTGARAAELSRAVRAEAFTWGTDIVFGDGRYAPSSAAGRHLLAHELVHVAQQSPGAAPGVVMRRWDAATAECAGEPTDKWIERVVVEQETPQSVTVHWSDRTVEADTSSAGKGHCCVAPGSTDGTACDFRESRRSGSNCTPISDGAGFQVRHRDLDHRGIPFWTEFVPTRHIALHQYTPVDGTPLSHGCVRLHRAMAKKIFCGVRQRRSRVVVRGFARPMCNHPALQQEWLDDFALAASEPPDGDRRRASAIREERRALREAFGRRVTPAELRGFTAADIPRCTRTGPRPTAEENRLTTPVASTGTPAAEILVRSGFEARVLSFVTALLGAWSYARARRVVEQHGRGLWQAAVARAQGTSRDTDDRPLYWARLEMTRALRQWQPRFTVSATRRAALFELLETTSRGMTTARFSRRGHDKRILISGFDPFSLSGTGSRRGNPSGAAVLALDGRRLTDPVSGQTAVVQGVIFPVRFADFDAGRVETFFRPYMTATVHPDMIMTISQGGSTKFEVEEYAGRRRSSGATDNLGVLGGGSSTHPVVPPGLGPGAEFLRTTLPVAHIRSTLGRTTPLTGETEVEEIPSGSTTPVTRLTGPTVGSTSVRGSGGGYLSNEIFYRTSLLRVSTGATIPVGHLHTPYMAPPSSTFSTSHNTQRDTIVNTIEKILTDVIPHL